MPIGREKNETKLAGGVNLWLVWWFPIYTRTLAWHVISPYFNPVLNSTKWYEIWNVMRVWNGMHFGKKTATTTPAYKIKHHPKVPCPSSNAGSHSKIGTFQVAMVRAVSYRIFFHKSRFPGILHDELWSMNLLLKIVRSTFSTISDT